jgi:hypothetical protein
LRDSAKELNNRPSRESASKRLGELLFAASFSDTLFMMTKFADYALNFSCAGGSRIFLRENTETS